MAASSPPASAPVGATGQAAVEQSQRMQQSRDVKTQAALAVAQKEMAAQLQGVVVTGQSDAIGRQTNQATQIVAGRHFQQSGAVWTDLQHAKTQRGVKIEPLSKAYFAVLARLPELENYWKQLDEVLDAGKRVSVQISKGGASTMSTAELTQLVTEFRSH